MSCVTNEKSMSPLLIGLCHYCTHLPGVDALYIYAASEILGHGSIGEERFSDHLSASLIISVIFQRFDLWEVRHLQHEFPCIYVVAYEHSHDVAIVYEVEHPRSWRPSDTPFEH